MSPTGKPRELLALAEKDYKAALILARAEDPQMDAAGFHLQQAVEKSLKAWLAQKGVEYPRTHDLSLLFGLLEDRGERIDPFWSLLELNSFAVQFRYELPGEEFSNFKQFAKLTKKLLAHIQSILDPG
jgi:HEPN domain-containing protein